MAKPEKEEEKWHTVTSAGWRLYDLKPEIKVHPKAKKVMQKERLNRVEYEYRWPFNYPNVKIRTTYWTEMHGVELDPPPVGYIDIEEESPIVGVTIIGSACSPPGWVMIEGEPIAELDEPSEATIEIMKYYKKKPIVHPPVRMRVNNLWGMHIRGDLVGIDVNPVTYWMAGMSSAHFEIPKCRKVRIMGGSEVGGASIEPYPDDIHYSFRIIRLTILEK